MKSCRKLLAVVLVVMLLASLSAAAFASSEEPAGKVITSVTLAEKDANYVDSALYSQYETVTFSDGTSQSIDVDAQTFILVRDGAVVDLADPANWTADAELFVIDKGRSDTVMMSMNTANWGPFWFTGVVDIEDGAYQEARSIPAAADGVTVTDDSVTGGEINIDADYISAIYVYNEDGSKVTVSDVTVNSAGRGGNDFGTNGGWGTGISVAGSAEMDIKNVTVNTEGPLNDGIWAGGSSVVNVYDSAIFATDAADNYNYRPYTYDRFIITDAPLTQAEIAERGISGEFYTEDYTNMFGAGTHYYYNNENWTNNFSAPMLQCPPIALGLYGTMRGAICYGNATLSFYNSLAVCDNWAVLSTDSGRGVLNATDTVAIIGAKADEADADVRVLSDDGAEEYYIDIFDTTEGSGYVTYCDGFDDNFYGCRFYAPDYLAIMTGGTFDFVASDTQRGYGCSDRIGFMSHGQAYTALIQESDFDVADALFAVMSTGAVDITLDDVTVNYTKDNPWGHKLFQFMDTDDVGTDANDLEMDVVDLTLDEYLANTPGDPTGASAEGTTKTVVIRNSVLEGDIWNSTGSSNNKSTLAAYDGSTNRLSTWSTSTVDLTLDGTELTGQISTSYAQHCDENGQPIVGQFFFNRTGEPMDGTAANTYDYLAARRVINTPAYNGIGRINVTLTNGAVWNVTDKCIINSLTIGEGCAVNGIVTENADGTITVVPALKAASSGEASEAPAGGEQTIELTTISPFAGEIRIIVTYTAGDDGDITITDVVDPDLGESIFAMIEDISGILAQVEEAVG